MLMRLLFNCTVENHIPVDFFLANTAHQTIPIMFFIGN